MKPSWYKQNQVWIFPFLYLVSRVIYFIAFMPYDYYGFGDLPVYYAWTALPGFPYFSYWVEYPPLFPFISELLLILAREQRFVYDFLMCIIIAAAGMGMIIVFRKIAVRVFGEEEGQERSLIFNILTLFLPYNWWYAEPITVFLFLLGIWLILQQNDSLAGIWIGIGMLSKWFPLFLLPGLLGFRSWKRLVKISLIAVGLTALVFGILWIASPEMTTASLIAQPGRSSWQTIWALLDNNLTTGAFLTIEDRLHPEIAGIPRGNPALISNNLTLALFGLLGAFFLWKRNTFDDRSYIAFTGITWVVFLLWSPGWSPQWMLYLIPLILLSLPLSQGLLITILFILLTFIEWPLLLMRDLFQTLWLIAPLRMILLTVFIILWYQQIHLKKSSPSM